MKVIAVVVTYNRQELLSRCLDHLLAQTRPVDSLLVINNGSTDGTEEMLSRRGIAVLSQENVGSAGGWHVGIAHALALDFDAVWLMDDDGYPDSSALACLSSEMRDGIACASSVVLREDQPELFVFPFPVLDSSGLPVLFWPKRKLDSLNELSSRCPSGLYPFAHLFNGALVSLRAVVQVGNVDPAFFMSGDEVDYFFRLRAAGDVISVISAKHYHPNVELRPFTPLKMYYYLKNTLVLNERYFDSVLVRNVLTVIAVLVRSARRNGLSSVISLLFGRLSSPFYSAIARGLAGQIGKDFDG